MTDTRSQPHNLLVILAKSVLVDSQRIERDAEERGDSILETLWILARGLVYCQRDLKREMVRSCTYRTVEHSLPFALALLHMALELTGFKRLQEIKAAQQL